MAVRRYLRKRGANVTVQAYGEILVMPTGDFGKWKRRLDRRVERETAKEAPVNKRPRWGHYGKPLKRTIMSRTETRITKGGGFIFGAVGSSAPHAYYVDQGTGIYNGSGPWKAKVLPPYARGEASLYEASWHPPGQTANHTVMIKGQKGQRFFEKGLDRAWRSLGDARYHSLGGKVSAASRIFPEGIANFRGNTPGGKAFQASLTEWRAWRDAAFNSGRIMGRDGGAGTREDRRREVARARRLIQRTRRADVRAAFRAKDSATRSKKWREKQRETKSTAKKEREKTLGSPREQKAILEAKKVMAKWLMQHPNGKILNYNKDGFNYELKKGNQIIREGQPWGVYLVDLFYGVD